MGRTAQPAVAQVPITAQAALVSVGFTAVVAQIVLMRELLTVSSGNELSLGIALGLWLIWTAIGCNFLGSHFHGRSPRKVLPLLLIAAAVALNVSILTVRTSRNFWNAAPGEVLGPGPIFLTAFLALAVFCPISGWLFVIGSRLYAESVRKNPADGASSMYLLEAVGSASGGMITSILFIRVFSSMQIAAVVASLNVLAAIWVGVTGKTWRRVLSALAVLVGLFVTTVAARFELQFVSRSWPGFRVLATRTSHYGNSAVVETEGSRSVIQNGTILFTSPDLASAEEAVHFPLLEHPNPKSVLLVGGGLSGSIAEILKHPSVSRVDYVELDPAVLRLGREYFPQTWSVIASDPRVHVHESDGRLFVKFVSRQFDVIILNLPEPQTAQLNRFYTEEFFREASSRLAPGGIFGFQMRASEEYLSPQMRESLRCLNATLRSVFIDVVTIPGETMHFLSSQQSGTLTTDPQLLLRRIGERGLRTTYIRDYYLPYRMTAERVSKLNEQLQPQPDTRVNRDFAPIAYFFSVELWSTQFSDRYRSVFSAMAAISFRRLFVGATVLIILITGILLSLRGSFIQNRIAAGYSVTAMGLTLMGSEILLLLGFQAIYGYVFNELAVIVAGFMAGMATGSWLALHLCGRSSFTTARKLGSLFIIQALAALLLLLLTPCLAALGRSATTLLVHLGILTLAAVCGFVGGYQFPIAMRLFSSGNDDKVTSPGALYGLDLLGASVGAIVISALILPLFGFARTAGLVAIANLGPALLLAVSGAKTISSSE